MKKTLLIGLKDVKLLFRDQAALVLMLLAPFLLTVGMGFVTGRFSGSISNSGLADIPVVIINQDEGELGQALVDVFNSAELADLLEPSESQDVEAARALIDANEAAAVVLIPAGFTASIIPQGETAAGAEAVKIELYANPTTPVSAGVVQTLLDGFLSQVETGRVAGQVAVSQLLRSGLIAPQQAASLGQEIGARQAELAQEASAIQLRSEMAGEAAVEFDVLAYLAPGMALMFLMFTTTYGGRSILLERNQGTLPRLLVSPTTVAQVLGGKVLGIYLTGVLQVGILILASTLLFGVKWGDPLGVALLVLAAVFGATGWGMLLTAFARTPAQVSSIGSALMLTFGILGGSFISLNNLPTAVQWISRITPNAWGLDGFTELALGGTLADLGTPLLALVVMGIVLFGAAVLAFNRQAILQK